MDIKNTLISIRESKGYSKRTVSEMTGIPYTTYIKYESGERKDVSMDALVKIADFYGVTTDYLLGREPEKNPIAMLNLAIGEKEALEMYIKLPEEVRQIIIDTMIKLGEVAKNAKYPEIASTDAGNITNNNLKPMTYPVKTAARRGINGEYSPITTEYLTAEEISDIINAEDADDDL